jgi:protein SCO1/2
MRHHRLLAARALAGILTAGLLAACAADSDHSSAPESSSKTQGWSGAIPSSPMRKPDITLTDQDRHRFALKPRTQGKVTLLYFGYTHCPDVCPLTMSMLAGAVKALPAASARDVAVVFVTTDPARDTPMRLKQWLANFDSSFVGLTGSKAAIAEAQQLVGSPPSVTEPDGKGGYGVDHGAFIYAYTPDDLAHIVYFQGVQPAALAADLRRLASGAVPAAT